MDKLNSQIFEILRSDIARGDLRLPSLPQVVTETWALLRDPATRGEEIARVVQRDPVLAARLVAIANSALYRRRRTINDLHQAVVVLGNDIVKHTLTVLAVSGLYRVGKRSVVRPYLNREWSHATLVAGIADLLAGEWEHLSADAAMLGGMIHRIGVLPLLALAEREPRLVEDARVREHVISGLHVQVGLEVLAAWAFPDDLLQVVREHENLERENHGMVDYVDIVQAAVVISYRGTDHPLARLDWAAVPATSLLGLTEADADRMLDYCGTRVGELRSLLT